MAVSFSFTLRESRLKRHELERPFFHNKLVNQERLLQDTCDKLIPRLFEICALLSRLNEMPCGCVTISRNASNYQLIITAKMPQIAVSSGILSGAKPEL